MKKIFLTGIILAILYPLSAQTNSDALRASEKIYSGTARFQSMGGAFNSLGGDFSSISLNPAGLGVYRSSELSFSPTLQFNNSTTSYLGTDNEEFSDNFSINNLGLVINFPVNSYGWEAVNLGIGFNRNRTFDQNIFYSTSAAEGSLLDEFAYNANNGFGEYFYEGMALATDAIYYVENETGEVFTDATSDEIDQLPVYQEFSYESDFGYYQMLNGFENPVFGHALSERHQRTGRSSEFNISLGANYANKLYIGGGIGVNRFRRESTIQHIENTSGSDFEATLVDGDIYVQDFTFRENYLTYGSGVNFKVGVIARPIEFLRIGAAIHSPTFQNIETEFSTSSNVIQNDGIRHNEISDLGVNQFTVYTPFKLETGISFQFEKIALLSIDYEYMDYSRMKIKSDDENFSDLNNEINETYQAVNNLRAGLEVRFSNIFLRGGYAYYGSPYAASDFDDLNVQQYSGGLGILINKMKLDFGYVYQQDKEVLTAYDISPIADVTSITNRFVATLAFRF